MTPLDSKQLEKMHRYFAVECNNRAWELAEQDSRTDAEDRELLCTSHAAAYHWGKVGTPVNEARAKQLLAEAYAQCGEGERALILANECREFFAGGDGNEWDRAFTSLELALAHAVCGNMEEASRILEEASTQGTQIVERGERDFFAESHRRIADRIAKL